MSINRLNPVLIPAAQDESFSGLVLIDDRLQNFVYSIAIRHHVEVFEFVQTDLVPAGLDQPYVFSDVSTLGSRRGGLSSRRNWTMPRS